MPIITRGPPTGAILRFRYSVRKEMPAKLAEMENYLNWKVALAVAPALLSFGEHYYLRNNASETAKAKRARAGRLLLQESVQRLPAPEYVSKAYVTTAGDRIAARAGIPFGIRPLLQPAP